MSDIKKYNYIDSLRGIAILMVIIYHASVISPTQNAILNTVFSFGERGVQLFYLVSAITLCMSWDQRAHLETKPVQAFFIRRFFRIAPLYYTVVAIHTSMLVLAGSDPLQLLPHILSNITFTHSLHPASINHLVPGGWSVGIEVLFYLMLPWLIINSRTKSAPFCIAILAASMALMVICKYIIMRFYNIETAVSKQAIQNFAFFNISSQLPVFLIGMFFYKFKESKLAIPLLYSLTVAGAALCGLVFLQDNDFLNKFFYTFKHIIACPALLLLISVCERTSHPIFVRKPLVITGTISFGLYLLHFFSFPIIEKMKSANNIGFLTTLTIMLILSIPAAWLAYTYIEKQGIATGKKLIKVCGCQ